MEKKVFDVVLLNALPASGKSELRKFMNENDPGQMVSDFHIGKNLQLDDFPYVWLMRQVDKKLAAMGRPTLYYPDDESPTYDGRVWGVLSILLSEDYQDLVNRNYVQPANAAEYLFERFDRASVAAGLKPLISLLDDDIRKKLAEEMEEEARALLNEKQAQYTEDLSDKTIIIEFSRGGNDGAAMPLTGTFGYQYTYSMLSPDLLRNAAVLYIWVTPEDSRAKNDARYDPNNPGSSINHKTPDKVMMYDYGCDDILYMKEVSEIEDTLTVEAWGQKFHLPVGVFDNREDLTTQFRGPKETWDKESVEKAVRLVSDATARMWAKYKK
ncbi:MAG: hypothetical protein IJM79_02925 [Erysipelotrichaceae bacterium]|nr:hypothetical protein [Erysipelotrichaceae bacterium]